MRKMQSASLIQTHLLLVSFKACQSSLHWIMGNRASASVHQLYTRNQIGLWVKSSKQMLGMNSFTQNLDIATKLPAPNNIGDRELFWTNFTRYLNLHGFKMQKINFHDMQQCYVRMTMIDGNHAIIKIKQMLHFGRVCDAQTVKALLEKEAESNSLFNKYTKNTLF